MPTAGSRKQNQLGRCVALELGVMLEEQEPLEEEWAEGESELAFAGQATPLSVEESQAVGSEFAAIAAAQFRREPGQEHCQDWTEEQCRHY